ncbi:hypothetical protein HHK36_014028 [Tetracentron sinense]|uniref:Protein TIFY n=1 Tax=Tetracentron sinense TaxID=13715 RepID=A0A835DDW0_TETSI|nr:hypothetical protein HHK36_014028 [Tetracentron sinense]
MAVLIMAQNNNNIKNKEEKPIFHDFLGMSSAFDSPVVVVGKSVSFGSDIRLSEASVSALASVGASSGGHGLISATSDLGSERQVGNHIEGVPFSGPKSDFSGPEISKVFSGRKRSNLDSAFTGSMRDRMPQMGPDSLESSHLMKILRNGEVGERPRRSHDEELLFGMQPPRPISTSVILQPPIGSRPDSVVSKWKRSMPMNAAPIVQYPPHLGQFAPFRDKVSSNRYRDANAGPSLISQPAADEGSRTGIKGSGILSSANACSGGPERNSSGVMPGISRQNSGINISDPESSNSPSRHGLMSSSRQMTIFYAGQAHVFDDVHPNKADVIMTLAGSNGGSWSTTYSPKSSARPPLSEAYIPTGDNEKGMSNLALPQELRGRLSVTGNSSHRFSHGGQTSTTPGGHQGGVLVRDVRPPAQAAEQKTEGKREV